MSQQPPGQNSPFSTYSDELLIEVRQLTHEVREQNHILRDTLEQASTQKLFLDGAYRHEKAQTHHLRELMRHAEVQSQYLRSLRLMVSVFFWVWIVSITITCVFLVLLLVLGAGGVGTLFSFFGSQG